ncbi:MAG: hypothetical protein OQK11_02880 [Thiovulaceae bacterium]|nr:hypothetical protein [Sulfurimonadaceae bacterium]
MHYFRQLSTALLLGILLLSGGCGSSDTRNDKLSAQQLLDSGDYDGAIAKMEPIASSDADYKLLGDAYMGKAGVSFSDLLVIISNSADSTDGSFAAFIDNIDQSTSSSSLSDLEMSKEYYGQIVGTSCTDAANDNTIVLNTTEENICLLIGLVDTVKAATTISYLADEVSTLSSSDVTEDPKLQASACAMQYAFDGNDTNVDAACTVTQGDNITFVQSQNTYDEITVVVNASSFDYIITDTNNTLESTALTDGYCTLDDFNTRADYNYTSVPADYYVCPINESSSDADITTAKVLVDAINDGTESIGIATNEEVQDSIDEFKCELIGGTYTTTCSTSLEQDITEEQIINYLNLNN